MPEPVSSEGKHVTFATAGKHANGAKSGKCPQRKPVTIGLVLFHSLQLIMKGK